MSSDYFFDDDFDDAALAEVEAIETAALQQAKAPAPPVPAPRRPQPQSLKSDSSIDMTFDIDESELAKLDDFVAQQYNEKVLQAPQAGPSSRPMNRTTSSNMLQTTLFGDIIPTQSAASKLKSPPSAAMQRTKSATRNIFGQQAPKTKIWDHTAFAQSGNKPKKGAKGKGKGKASTKDDDDDEEDSLELPVVPVGPPPPMRLKPDLLEAKHWIFPTNRAKRDYQYNIVKNCLFDNTLVALPTGLGKTFVAGVVMLNYYRWFPEGKIVFVAPTKPLVAQQIVASHDTCGIPGYDGVELTGQVKSATRGRFWQEKRVFYMTPQTMESDLASGACDPLDVVLLVIDEAHHATGDYSYNKIVRFMMAKNPHFRLLALTATPGNNPDSVQRLVDGLHISKIEIRNESSLDLKPYIFEKVVKPHIIKPRDDVLVIQELLSKVMEPIFDPLQKMGLFYPSEKVIALHPFRPMGILRDRNPLASKHYTQLTQLSSLARAVLYLLTGSIKSCRDYCEEIMQKELTEKAAGKARKTMLIDNPNFKRLMEKFEEFEKPGSTPHPKMEKLKDILINYFGTKMPDAVEGEPDKSDDTRVMVFSSYRAVVEEIIGELNQHRPLIRAAAFVGQATAKNGTKGLKQREQIELIERFQKGEFNVLVATSIGEEGLDIGEIDCTICYDTDKAPTRMIQRFGRTGRKRAGEVHALLAEAREEFNLDKAKGTYKEVQKVIDRGELYELYGDVPRLIPEHVKPSCIEKVMEITPYVREDLRKARSKGASTGGTKRKRNTDPNRNIPPDMPTSFTPASSVWSTFKKPKVAPLPEDPRELEELGTDDDLDRQIEAGSIFTRRTQSDKPPATKKKASSPAAKLRRSGTTAAAKKQAAKEKEIVKKYAKKSLAELEKEGEDDELDMQFESGSIFGSFQPVSKLASLASSSKRRLTPDPPMKTYEITDTEEEEFENGGEATDDGEEPKSPSPARYDRKFGGEDMAWLVEDDEDIGVEAGSPEPIRVPSPKFERLQFEGDDSIEISQAYPARPKGKQKATLKRTPPSSPGIEIVESGPSKPLVSFQPASKVSFAPEPDAPTSRAQKRKTDMLPPPVPFNRTPLSSPSWEAPEPTFPVSKPKRRRVTAVASSDDDEPLAPLPPSQHRLHRRNLESTPAKPKPRPKKKEPKPHRTKPSLLDKNLIGLVGEAAHSGDEVSEGYSEEEEERSSDREFLKDSPSMTQISPSYEQTQMYRQSLFTQAPVGDKAPAFQRGPLRAKPFGQIDPSTTTRKFLPSSSPPLEDDELDSYEHGSFVVADEGDISIEINSDDAVLDW